MMKNNCIRAMLICLLVVIHGSVGRAQTVPSDEISIAIPRHVITNMIQAALPLELDKGPYLKGDLWINTIDHLKIGSDKVVFDMNIRGKNVKLETRLGNQTLLMDIGNLNAVFNCTASFRYDAPGRLLYITPVIVQKPAENKADKVEANLLQLLSLANGSEYPVEIQKFQPFVTQISRDQFSIDMEITNIYTGNDSVFISGRPKFTKIKSSSPSKKKPQ